MILLNASIDIEQVMAGNKVAVSKALNLVENRSPVCADAVLKFIETVSKNPRSKRHIVGISGPPGVGKSSMISQLIQKYRAQNKTVGVLSVDPSSKKSGGALLGDRVRIKYDPKDPGVFIRSMAAGQHLGGLAKNTILILMVFEAVYDRIILETVGVGQSETEIENVVDTVVLVIQPGSGDLLQFMKAGIMEIPHILVINKSDQQALATKTFHDLSNAIMIELLDRKAWKMEVVLTSVTKETGFDSLIRRLQEHRKFLGDKGVGEKRKINCYYWVMGSFKERYGSFGAELLGGDEEIMKILKLSGLTNPLTGLKLLTEILNKKIDIKTYSQ